MSEETIVNFEAVVKPQDAETPEAAEARSIFGAAAVPAVGNLDRYRADKESSILAARKLANNGVTINDIGEFSISASCPAGKFEALFGTKLTEQKLEGGDLLPEGYRFLAAGPDAPWSMPRVDGLDSLLLNAYTQADPLFFAGERPIPPRWTDKFRLRVPVDVAQIMRASSVHRLGITGKGVRVAMPDSGFYHHPYFQQQGYNFLSVTAPDVLDHTSDASGHGTGEAANLFATAPGINFIGVKMGNPTLAFKTAVALRPQVMTNSWGYHLDLPNTSMPNWLKPLHLAILDAVAQGIVVCFSAGNGHLAFPACMPEVIAVGGVHVDQKLVYEASNYASSFRSTWFPGRKVPDACGLVGMQTKADYIILPVQKGAQLEKNGGWGAFSGTSAASPMVAGVCALLCEADPSLKPDEIKTLLQYTAKDITKGHSRYDPAGPGPDLATGFGLVDAARAIEAIL